jgi:large subunit ribosomal protein L17
MRHRKAGNPLGKTSSHRRAMLRNMVTSLFKHEQIETTDAKAKSLKPVAEKMITLAKRGDLHARRQALAYIQDKVVAHRLFDEIKDRYMDRQGGYIRIIKKSVRKGDGASVSVVQLLPPDEVKKSPKKKSKKPKSQKAEAKPAEKEEKAKTLTADTEVAEGPEEKKPRKARSTKVEGGKQQKKERKVKKATAVPEEDAGSEKKKTSKSKNAKAGGKTAEKKQKTKKGSTRSKSDSKEKEKK